MIRNLDHEIVMKNTYAAVLVGIAIFSTGFALTSMTDAQNQPELRTTSSGFTGHLTYSVLGADGLVKEYHQTDNFILSTGENCALKALFFGSGSTGSATMCNENFGTFNYIALLNDTDGDGGCTSASNQLNHTAGSCTLINSAGLAPVQDSSVTVNTVGSGDTEAQIEIDASFSSITTLGSGGNTILASALVNDTAVPFTTFAKAQTNGATTGVTVNNGDTLNITWTINAGGTSSLDDG